MWDTEKFVWTLSDDVVKTMWKTGLDLHENQTASFISNGGTTSRLYKPITLKDVVVEKYINDRNAKRAIGQNEKIIFAQKNETASLIKTIRQYNDAAIDNIYESMPHSWVSLIIMTAKYNYSFSASSERFGLMIRLLLSN